MQTTDYKSVSKSFRPLIFSEVAGQNVTTTTLINAIQNKSIANAYLFCGMRGTGKTTLARIFAKSMNCENLQNGYDPCNKCTSCRAVSEASSLDIIEIDGASNRGIDDIRNLKESFGYSTFGGKFKIFIIDEVHMLTKEAFNALLKSIEEPPKNVKFLLATTEYQKIPLTIVSRCQRFDLSRIPQHEIIKRLRHIAGVLGIKIDDCALGLIAKFSEGSLRDAESLLDQISCYSGGNISSKEVLENLKIFGKEEFFELDVAYKEKNFSFAFDFASKLFNTGKDISLNLDVLLEHYRNITLIMLNKLDLNDSSAMTQEEIDGYKRAMQIYDMQSVLYIIDYVSNILYKGSKSSIKRIHLEMILLHIIKSKNIVSLEQILENLNGLESQKTQKPKPDNQISTISTEQNPKQHNTDKRETPTEQRIENKTNNTENIKKLSTPVPETDSVKHETVMRFASVEFGGSLKKNF